jgi:transcriptional regulator with XRE-family HTH domain
MQRIPAHVSLRALREARGLTAGKLAGHLRERGIDVDPNHIYDVELGRKCPSFELRTAWAEVLGIGVLDIRTDGEIRDLITAADASAKPASVKAA